ncbi:sigma-70 family RNA polymerase sigma factor [Chryseobacterium sp. KCF3-3]|uniref:sigma-70 family RNA polymerase sigma factor n=1 Tax=Chryseobacterium sp. KCF3-3 TaxID=3231511 RepID=UPI0038B3147B
MTVEEIEDILLVISEKSDDETSALAAFSKLYKSYSKFLSAVISGALKNSGIYDEQVLNTVMNNTFFKIYENPLIFSFPENAIENNFKAWLSTVARNELKRLLIEYYRNKEESLSNGNNDVAIIESEVLPEGIFESVNLKVLNDALNLLSERDRHILLTLYMYYEEGMKTPSDVLDLLCEMYGTTKPNIRKIKERSEKKIIEHFSKYTELKPLKHDK